MKDCCEAALCMTLEIVQNERLPIIPEYPHFVNMTLPHQCKDKDQRTTMIRFIKFLAMNTI